MLSTSLPLALAALAAPTPQDLLFEANAITLTGPVDTSSTPPVDGPYSSMVAGDFNLDADLDLAFIESDLLQVAPSAAIFRTVVEAQDDTNTNIAATAMDAWSAASSGEDASLLISNSSGLARVYRKLNDPHWHVDSLGVPQLKNARTLHVDHDIATGVRVVSGVSYDGLSAAYAVIDGATTTVTTVFFGFEIRDAIAIDRFQNGQLEIAVGANTFFAVVSAAGVPQYFQGTECIAFDVFERADGLPGAVWLSNNGSQDFLVIDSMGQAVDAQGLPATSQPLGSIGVTDLRLGDFNGDSLQDLALTGTVAPRVHLMTNNNGVGVVHPTISNAWLEDPYFTAPGQAVDLGAGVTDPVMTPVLVADIDGDEFMDLAFERHGEDRIGMLAGTSAPGAASIEYGGIRFLADDATWANGDPNLSLTTGPFYLLLPTETFNLPPIPPSNGGAPREIALEFAVYNKPINGDVDPTPVVHRAFTASQGQKYPLWFDWDFSFDGHKFVMIRHVLWDTGTGRRLRNYPPLLLGWHIFENDIGTDHDQVLLDLDGGDALTEVNVTPHFAGTLPTDIGGIDYTAAYPIEFPPPTSTATAPTPGPWMQAKRRRQGPTIQYAVTVQNPVFRPIRPIHPSSDPVVEPTTGPLPVFE